MSVENHTPFPALAFRQYNMVGELMGVVVARGTFKLTKDGPLQLADEQYPLVMSDTYEGDPHETPHLACTDLAPFKPGTDVTFVGASFAPGGKAQSSWTCGLKVGSVDKRLRVHGPRLWRARTRKTWRGLIDRDKEDALDGWELTPGDPVAYVPIDWRLAFGGRRDEGELEANPLGMGLVGQTRFKQQPEWPAPRIELEDQPIQSVTDRPQPAGFAPISPFWKDRAELAGTYDEDWVEKRHPLLPEDFDYAFWQAAPRDQIAEPWLEGNEPFELTNLLPGFENLRGSLPGLALQVSIEQGAGSQSGLMVLDGVHFYMRPGVGRVFLTWRCNFLWPEREGLPRLEMAHVVEGV
ncbi:DUF2169 family type VI secretion system accessory protein [Rhizobium oryzicola]|uniref:DUF2169 domain-containing protein n=1 Tax=Rhizobium oryzicola TaxID=1232668 RepID=A0ABT8SXB8_9HYPH|nr:DUF2169 domain-containing protein [Rhizobium oryzicola]MDO1583078.1 DUF2169 domain-containing protein [Rhizobium oryzicola]